MYARLAQEASNTFHFSLPAQVVNGSSRATRTLGL
jgi:hypothetical protein